MLSRVYDLGTVFAVQAAKPCAMCLLFRGYDLSIVSAVQGVRPGHRSCSLLRCTAFVTVVKAAQRGHCTCLLRCTTSALWLLPQVALGVVAAGRVQDLCTVVSV